MTRQTLRFALSCGASQALVALALVPWGLSRGGVALGWGLAGWLAAALVGAGGGAWLVARHGAPGARFPAALAASMLSRMILFVALPFAAAAQGREAIWGAIVGLFAGYLPALAAEVLWFARATPDRALGSR